MTSCHRLQTFFRPPWAQALKQFAAIPEGKTLPTQKIILKRSNLLQTTTTPPHPRRLSELAHEPRQLISNDFTNKLALPEKAIQELSGQW